MTAKILGGAIVILGGCIVMHGAVTAPKGWHDQASQCGVLAAGASVLVGLIMIVLGWHDKKPGDPPRS